MGDEPVIMGLFVCTNMRIVGVCLAGWGEWIECRGAGETIYRYYAATAVGRDGRFRLSCRRFDACGTSPRGWRTDSDALLRPGNGHLHPRNAQYERGGNHGWHRHVGFRPGRPGQS